MPVGKAPRPLIVAIDGRSGAGKTTLAVEVAARLRGHHNVSLFHLEDIYPGWNGLHQGLDTYRRDVLLPLSRGDDPGWRPWDWNLDVEGAARTTAPTEIVLVEGVGAGHRQARPLIDVVVWLSAPEADRKERALDRDGDLFAPYWDQWAVQEADLLEGDDIPASADLLVQGHAAGALHDQVIAALAALPQAESLLLPERTQNANAGLRMQCLDVFVDAARCFADLYAAAPKAVWLDSSDAGGGHTPGRFSIMADDGGSHGRFSTHSSGLTTVQSGAVTSRIRGPFFRWLDSVWGHGTWEVPEGYPGGFTLGCLGYLRYDPKREPGGADVRTPPPDAALLFAGRALVVDHDRRCIYLLVLDTEDTRKETDEWLRRTAEKITRLSEEGTPGVWATVQETGGPKFTIRDPRAAYLRSIGAARQEIADGNSYEICLTTQLECHPARPIDPWRSYLDLRSRSPAPFAAYLQLDGITVASSSPERFLRISAGGALRAEPIKGTRRRDPDPVRDAALRDELAGSAKDRAENIMIVDLLRNDLSHFSIPDSLAVSRLCAVESYATVHQLVSTIDAQLRPGADRAAAVAAAFPAGSMTGAPKISTMAILDRLEQRPRGVYSGALGYFSLDGSADLSVVIRTLVFEDGPDAQRLTLGVGGAITADSSPEAEWEEIQTKAHGVLSALGAGFPADVAGATSPPD